jgi:hypothetical protein
MQTRFIKSGARGLIALNVRAERTMGLVERVREQRAGQDQTDSSLNLAGPERRLPILGADRGGLAGEALHHVAHQVVQDVHGLTGDRAGGVNLAQHLEERVFEIDLHANGSVALGRVGELPPRGRSGAALVLQDALARLVRHVGLDLGTVLR